MNKIDNVEVEPLKDAKFVKPYRLSFTQNNVSKSWEVISVHPSVAVIIFNTDRKKLVLVQQFRPAVYFSTYPRSEREIHKCALASAATQATSAVHFTQQTQTVQQPAVSQETQTACPEGTSNCYMQSAEESSASQCSQSTQSSCVPQCSQSTQIGVTQCSQSTQSMKTNCCQSGGGCDSALSFCSTGYECSSSSGCAASSTAQSSSPRKRMPSLPGECGITMELCAGIVDKQVPLSDIAKEEVLEECGYDVPLQNIIEVITFRAGVGSSGDKQTLFYAEVTDAMKVSEGGGLVSEGELIEVVELSIPEARQLLQQHEVMSPGGLLFAFMWFLTNKASDYE